MLTSLKDPIELEFFENPNVKSSINTKVFIDHQEWKLYDHVDVAKLFTYKSFSKSKKPRMLFTCHAGRR